MPRVKIFAPQTSLDPPTEQVTIPETAAAPDTPVAADPASEAASLLDTPEEQPADGQPGEGAGEQPGESPEVDHSTEPQASEPQAAEPGTAIPPTANAPEPAPSDANITEPNQQDGLLDEISKAEQECAYREGIVNELKEELKGAKKEYDGAVLKLRRLARGAVNDSRRPLFSGTATAFNSTASESVASQEDGEQPASDSASKPAGSDAWRSVLITELALDTIKGLGKAKLERLIDHCPTMGAFEDLRVQAGASGLPSVMPDGIGPKITDPMEELFLTWLTANREKFEGGNPPAAESEAAASQEQPAESASGESFTTPLYPTASEWETMSDDLRHAHICGRGVYISEDCAGVDGHLDQKIAAAPHWESGFEAYGRGDEVSDCPLVPGPEQDDWLRGFFAAGQAEEYEPSDGDEPSDGNEGESEEPDYAYEAYEEDAELTGEEKTELVDISDL
jgi:hypothetical protein